MYKFGKHTDIFLTGKDDSYTYLDFLGVKIRVDSKFKAERINTKGNWVEISWYDNGNHQARTSIYYGNFKRTLSRARLMCIVANGNPTEDKPFVKHINGNTMDDSPENLQWVDSLAKSKGTYRTEENMKLIASIPEGQRNWNNPEYQKLFNRMKGSDGLNHADRFRLKMKAQGLVRRKRFVDGVLKYVWVPKDTPRIKVLEVE